MNLEQALKRIEELNGELKQSTLNFKKEKDRLIGLVASWKRKVENKGLRRESLREGYNATTGMHYKTYEIALPGDLAITAVLDYLKEKELPHLYPYTFRKLDFMPKKKTWIYEVELDLEYDIRLEEEFLRKYYENNPY
ncbi:hypothetical protein ABE096_11560 [Robertmurraya massiliosenegalensis]|uniref:hypothetical protein n=1 Tax=Robertmurraya TaxID=2837507 RepID=UPI0039A5DE56